MDANTLHNGFGQALRLIRCRQVGCAAILCLLATSLFLVPDAISSSKKTTIDPVLAEKLKKPGSLTLRGSTINTALFTISEMWKINIVVGEEVSGKINGVFKDAPLYEILDSILLTNGYSYRPVGKSLVVMKIEALGDTNPMFVSETIQLKHAKAEMIANAIRMVSSPKGKLEAISSVNSILILDYPDRVQRARDLAKELDSASSSQPTAISNSDKSLTVQTYVTQFVKAEDLKQTLEAIKSNEGRVSVIPAENRIVVTDYPSQLRLYGDVIKRLDVPRKQVRVTAMIYDISVGDMQQLGINWSHALKDRPDANGDPQSLWALDSVTQTAIAPGSVGGVMTFMNLSRHFDINAVIQALDTADDARLLADPSISVEDNTLASIEIVSEIPYQQLTQTQEGGQIGTTAFRKAGVTLDVTPRIAADGTIAMKVKPSFSRLAGFTEQDEQPIIDTREAETTVRVVDGQTMVIGGLRQKTEIGKYTGITFLKDIPYIGWLFRYRDVSVRESELIVFITPQIITTDYYGNEREQVAHHVGQQVLDQIPVAKPNFCPPYDNVPEEFNQPYNHGSPNPAELHYPEEVKPRINNNPPEQKSTPLLNSNQSNNKMVQYVKMERLPPVNSNINKSREIVPIGSIHAQHKTNQLTDPKNLASEKSPPNRTVGHTQNKKPSNAVQQIPNTQVIEKPKPKLERFPPLPASLMKTKKTPNRPNSVNQSKPAGWMNELFER